MTKDRVWTLSDLPGVTFFHLDLTDHVFPRHHHPYWVVAMNESGDYRTTLGGAEVYVPRGTLLLVAPGEIHSGVPSEGSPWIVRSMNVEPGAMRAWLFQDRVPSEPPPLRSGLIHESELTREVLDAHRRSAADAAAADAGRRLGELLRSAFDSLDVPIDTAAPEAPRACVRSAREILDRNAGESLGLEELARRVSISRFHLVRAFKDDVGLTPFEYLRQVRVERALELIREGRPLADVATSTGFSDQSHLTRCFKLYHGVTPGRFAEGVGAS